jgi:MFS family permease
VGTSKLLKRRDFRKLYLAGATSAFGGALHYIALMWFALELGGPMGVIAVRLADSVPSLLFGLYGGAAADRFPRRTLLVSGDLVRGTVLLPLSAAALSGQLALWHLVVAACVLETATSWFVPAEGAMLPSLVDRDELQSANGLTRATANAVSIGGWAAAAGLVAVLPIGYFFALNALSFFVSALFLIGLPRDDARSGGEPLRIRPGIDAVRARPAIAVATLALGLCETVVSGCWIGGLPQLIRDDLGAGAAGFSLTMVGYAVGALGAGFVLTRFAVRRKARASVMCWLIALPGLAMFAVASQLGSAVAGGALVGIGSAGARVLLSSAAQTDAPPETLGRVLGLISLVDRGSHATGLLFVAPLFEFFSRRLVFAAAALSLALIALASAALLRARSSPVSPGRAA